MQAHGKRRKDAHFPGRSHSRPVSVFSYHGRLVAQVVAAERVRGRPRCTRWVSTMANQVPGGWVAVPCRTQASALSGVALGKLHKLPLGQGAGCSERDFQWERAWQAAVKCCKGISSLPRQAARAWRCHWRRDSGDAGFAVARSNETGHRQAAVRMHMHLALDGP